MNDYKRGYNSARDNIICMLIGLQNENGNDENSDTYKAYQKVMNTIESRMGRLMS